MINCGRTIARDEGIKSLWKGLTPFVGQLTLKYALRMGSNAFFLELMRDQVRGGWAAQCLGSIRANRKLAATGC
jgi:solute carrier family 25 citrate transporter 1